MPTTCPVVHPDHPSLTCVAQGPHHWHLALDPVSGSLVEWSTPAPPCVGGSEVVEMVRRTRKNSSRPVIAGDGIIAALPGEEWKDTAFRAAVHLAQTRDAFTVDDVWLAMGNRQADGDPRHIGQIMVRLGREGYAQPTGRVFSSAFRSGDTKEWASLIRKPRAVGVDV